MRTQDTVSWGFAPNISAEGVAINAAVERDIAQAISSGDPWSKYRPMLPAENIGAYVCGVVGVRHRGFPFASHVSHCVNAPWRFVCCPKCYRNFFSNQENKNSNTKEDDNDL